jgi:hypothetical protein
MGICDALTLKLLVGASLSAQQALSASFSKLMERKMQ